MRISARADYAVRAAVELTGAPGWTKAERVATAQSIPLPFLLTTLARLREEGLVESRRGVEGGYRLARPAAEIAVADVVRAVDGPLASVAGELVEDLDYPPAAAPLRETWVALRCAIRSVLEAVTLDDLASGALPPVVTDLLCGDGAWETRPEARRAFQGRRDVGHTPPS